MVAGAVRIPAENTRSSIVRPVDGGRYSRGVGSHINLMPVWSWKSEEN